MKLRSFMIGIALALCLALIGFKLAVSSQALNQPVWSAQVVDQRSVDAQTPLVLDSEGQTQVAYLGTTLEAGVQVPALIYAIQSQDGSSWTKYALVTGRTFGPCLDLAVDQSGYAYILYLDRAGSSTFELKYVVFKPGETLGDPDPFLVTTEVLEGSCSDFLLVDDRMPALSYIGSGGILKYYFKPENGIPDVQQISNDALSSPSLAIDTERSPRIAFINLYHQLTYVARDPHTGSWPSEIVTVAGSGLGDTAILALDSDGLPYVAYQGASSSGTGYTLHYASYNAGTWRDVEVDPIVKIGAGISLALDTQNRAHITYKEARQGTLHYAVQTEAGWDLSTVGIAQSGSYAAALALDQQDVPHIFTDDRGADLALKYLVLTTPEDPTPEPTSDPTAEPTGKPDSPRHWLFLPLVVR